jgi:hypothetical protein
VESERGGTGVYYECVFDTWFGAELGIEVAKFSRGGKVGYFVVDYCFWICECIESEGDVGAC